MNKKEILAVVYKMLEQYNQVTKDFLKSKDTGSSFFCRGFCYWIHNCGNSKIYYAVLVNELANDKPNGVSENDLIIHWYETYLDHENFQNSITPRIEHLKRTIARLEKEIINDTGAII